MARFRDIKTLQKFASAHASIHNHFNLDRHLTNRETFKKTAQLRWLSGVSWWPDDSSVGTSGDWFALN